MARAGGLTLRRANARMRGAMCGARGTCAGLPNGRSYRKNRRRQNKTPKHKLRGLAGGSDRRRSGDLSIFSRTLYQLSYRAKT